MLSEETAAPDDKGGSVAAHPSFPVCRDSPADAAERGRPGAPGSLGYALIAVFSRLLGLNVNTRRASSIISSPVFGFRPRRVVL